MESSEQLTRQDKRRETSPYLSQIRLIGEDHVDELVGGDDDGDDLPF